MADDKIPSLDPRVQKEATEAFKEYYNLELELNKTLEKRKNILLEQFGIKKDMTSNLINFFKRSSELNKLTEKAAMDEKRETMKLATIVDETKRREQTQIIESILQRKAGYDAELQLLKKIQVGGWLPIIFALGNAYALFVNMDKAAAEFRMKMGMTRDNVKGIRSEAEKLAISFQDVGVNIKGVYDSFSALGKEAGSLFSVTTEMVKTTALLKAQLGVSEENSAGFMRNMAAVSKSTMQSQKDMSYMAADMAAAAGVPLNQIMGDIATKSDVTLTMMSRIPNQIMRSAIELRRMGTSLNDAAKSSREILNFSDNINAEMEASVLLGRSINLQRARELAYRRDLEGSTKEILRITKSVNFENMDPFQQEAFAKATGKSVNELLNMVQAERQWDAARRDPNLKSKVEAYEKLHNSVEAEAKARGKNLELMIQQKANQDRLTSISNKWNQIMSKLGEAFLPIIDGILSIAPPMLDVLRISMQIALPLFGAAKAVVAIGSAFQTVGLSLAVVFEKSSKISSVFMKIGEMGEGMMGIFTRIGSIISSKVTLSLMTAARYGTKGFSIAERFFLFIGKIGGFIGKIGGFLGGLGKFGGLLAGFGKFIPVLGWVITGVQFITNLFKRMDGIKDAFGKGFWNGILFGLKAIGGALYDTLLKPFVDAWNWIKGIFVGHSPSQLALGILKGVTSVGAMMYDALTYPFRHAFAWIADKIPGMGKVAEKLRGGVGGLLNKPMETRATTAYVPAATITPDGVSVSGKQDDKAKSTAQEKPKEDANDKTLQDILGAINMLNSNLSSGKIGIYLDGQLVSATLARQTEFRGGYGVNKV